MRHQRTVSPGTLCQRGDKHGDSYLFAQRDGFTYNSPPRAQRRSIRKNYEHSLRVRSVSIAAHEGISHQQMGDASMNRTTAAMPGQTKCFRGRCFACRPESDPKRAGEFSLRGAAPPGAVGPTAFN
jgi:hypothetical protein